MKYFISYKQAVPWNGSVFNANEYRKTINAFFSKVDLVNPNLKTDQDASLTFDVPVRNLSPDASFPNELTFDIGGYVSSERDDVTGLFRSFVTLGGDVKIPRILSNGNTLKTIIAAGTKSINALGDTPEKSFFNGYKQLRESLVQTLADQISGSGKDIKVERQDAFTDPEPALLGPPTQTISGVTNKPPVVDNPNITLPSQEVKALDANAAQAAASKAQSVTGNVTSQAQGALSKAQGAVGGAVSQTQGAVGGAVSQAQGAVGGAVSQAQGVVGGAVSQAQGAVGGIPQSSTGILDNLSTGVKGALGGGALGAGIGALTGGGKGALIGVGAGILAGGLAGVAFDKFNPKGITPDGLGKNWSPDKFSPENLAGNDKFVDPKTGVIGSTSKLAAGLKGGLLGCGIGAGIGAIAGKGQGALIGGLSGTALGAGLSVGGITGGTLAGGGLGAGLGGLLGGGKGAAIGALSGGAIGAAAAKLASVQKGLPKPKIPKPTNLPRIKTIKIPNPNNTKTATDLLNLPNSGLV